MNLLLVDDDLDILEAIMGAIDFDALNIDHVYSATNADKAMQLIQTTPIHIMVTDIEMPNGSGIDLLTWVRDQKLPIVTLFCTCYADFNYAQKAIELKTFSYYLKPIRFEDFSRLLAAAVAEANRVNLPVTDNTMGADTQKQNDANAFWEQVLMESAPFAQALQQYSMLPYTESDSFILCFVQREDAAIRVPSWKRFSCKNMEDEAFAKSTAFHTEAVFRVDNADCYVFLCRQPEASAELKAAWETVAAYCNQHLSMQIHIYQKQICAVENMQECFEQLRKACVDDVVRGQLFYSVPDTAISFGAVEYHAPEMEQWEKWLTNGQGDILLSHLEAWLYDSIAQKRVNAEILQMLCSDVLQVVHVVLYRVQINAHALFADKEFETLQSVALYSVKNTIPYLKHLIDTTINAIQLKTANTSGVSLIRAYIDTHLSENLARASLAEITYMNPDYMARLFRQDTGVTLGAYILQQRMEQAKLLLLQTTDSVGTIALAVGYDNVSHFSQIFRQKVGCSPHAYRTCATRV